MLVRINQIKEYKLFELPEIIGTGIEPFQPLEQP